MDNLKKAIQESLEGANPGHIEIPEEKYEQPMEYELFDKAKKTIESKVPDFSKDDIVAIQKKLLEMADDASPEKESEKNLDYLGSKGDEVYYAVFNKDADGKITKVVVYSSDGDELKVKEYEAPQEAIIVLNDLVDDLNLDSVSYKLLKDLGILEEEPKEEERGQSPEPETEPEVKSEEPEAPKEPEVKQEQEPVEPPEELDKVTDSLLEKYGLKEESEQVVLVCEFPNRGTSGYPNCLFRYRGKYYFVDGQADGMHELMEYLRSKGLLVKAGSELENWDLRVLRREGKVCDVTPYEFLSVVERGSEALTDSLLEKYGLKEEGSRQGIEEDSSGVKAYIDRALKKVGAEVLGWIGEDKARVKVYEVFVRRDGRVKLVGRFYGKRDAHEVATILQEASVDRFGKDFEVKVMESEDYFGLLDAVKVLGENLPDVLRRLNVPEIEIGG